MTDEWSAKEKDTLLRLARKVMETYLASGKAPAALALEFDITGPLKRTDRGVFVTIKKKGKLRGCVGSVKPYGELFRMVIDTAVSSSSRDPRFKPLDLEELGNCSLEISLLSPPEKVSRTDEIEVGRDGLLIARGFFKGLLLPQVAVENGWDREEFLDQTCLKAGLPKHAWKEKVEIMKFTATVFGEQDPGASPSGSRRGKE